jgi:hypothetical protein
MAGDTIHFVPNAEDIELFKRRWDLSSFTFGEVFDQVMIGGFIILEGPPNYRYLFIKQTDALGFTANLKLRLSDARKDGSSRLMGPDQIYDLEIIAKGARCTLRDLTQRDGPEVELNMAAFMKNVHDCGAAVFHTMLMLFPELASRRDTDQFRKKQRW